MVTQVGGAGGCGSGGGIVPPGGPLPPEPTPKLPVGPGSKAIQPGAELPAALGISQVSVADVVKGLMENYQDPDGTIDATRRHLKTHQPMDVANTMDIGDSLHGGHTGPQMTTDRGGFFAAVDRATNGDGRITPDELRGFVEGFGSGGLLNAEQGMLLNSFIAANSASIFTPSGDPFVEPPGTAPLELTVGVSAPEFASMRLTATSYSLDEIVAALMAKHGANGSIAVSATSGVDDGHGQTFDRAHIFQKIDAATGNDSVLTADDIKRYLASTAKMPATAGRLDVADLAAFIDSMYWGSRGVPS